MQYLQASRHFFRGSSEVFRWCLMLDSVQIPWRSWAVLTAAVGLVAGHTGTGSVTQRSWHRFEAPKRARSCSSCARASATRSSSTTACSWPLAATPLPTSSRQAPLTSLSCILHQGSVYNKLSPLKMESFFLMGSCSCLNVGGGNGGWVPPAQVLGYFHQVSHLFCLVLFPLVQAWGNAVMVPLGRHNAVFFWMSMMIILHGAVAAWPSPCHQTLCSEESALDMGHEYAVSDSVSSKGCLRRWRPLL